MIKNLTKNTPVSKKITKANGFLKVTGLIGKKQPETIFFKTRFGIHTLFLKFPIDLIVVDGKKRVVFLKESVKPNTIVFWNFKYDNVFELPRKSINRSKTEKGDILDFKL